jgi:YegS/Rv2252/BmrU family lipid kinase
MPRNAVLIVNPTSGSYSRTAVDRALDLLSRGGVAARLCLTANAGDPARFALEACTTWQDPLVIVAGGDGTINAALNGLRPGKATLAVLPFGTANVLARELAIDSAEDAVARIVRGISRPLKVGLVQSGSLRRYFLLMAGVGVDGAVVAGVRHREKRLFGKGAYFLSALRTLRSWDDSLLEVTVDGRGYRCHTAIVCNAARYGGRFRLAPRADMFSPGFQVVCLGDSRRGAYFRVCGDLLRGYAPSGAGIGIVAGREIEIGGRKPMQVDGDAFLAAPSRIMAVEGFVRLIV